MYKKFVYIFILNSSKGAEFESSYTRILLWFFIIEICNIKICDEEISLIWEGGVAQVIRSWNP